MFDVLDMNELVLELLLFQVDFAPLDVFLGFHDQQVLFLPDVGLEGVAYGSFGLLLLMEAKRVLLDPEIELLKILEREVLSVIYAFCKIDELFQFHFVQNLGIMQTGLEHHEEVG